MKKILASLMVAVLLLYIVGGSTALAWGWQKIGQDYFSRTGNLSVISADQEDYRLVFSFPNGCWQDNTSQPAVEFELWEEDVFFDDYVGSGKVYSSGGTFTFNLDGYDSYGKVEPYVKITAFRCVNSGSAKVEYYQWD